MAFLPWLRPTCRCQQQTSSTLSLDHQVVALDPHWKRLRLIRSLDQLRPCPHRDRKLPNAHPTRIAPGLAGADVELPAVPGTFHHLAGARITIFPGRPGFHEAGLDAVKKAAAAVRAAVGEREKFAIEVEHHDGAAAGLDE